MIRLIEIAEQFNAGLITPLEFRNAIVLKLMEIEETPALELLSLLLIQGLKS